MTSSSRAPSWAGLFMAPLNIKEVSIYTVHLPLHTPVVYSPYIPPNGSSENHRLKTALVGEGIWENVMYHFSINLQYTCL